MIQIMVIIIKIILMMIPKNNDGANTPPIRPDPNENDVRNNFSPSSSKIRGTSRLIRPANNWSRVA